MRMVIRIAGLTFATTLLLTASAFAQPDGPECLDWGQAASSGPSPRSGHAMAYDPLRGVTVLFGGTDGNAVIGGTWEWDGYSWTLRDPGTGGPTPRVGHVMAFDPANGQVLLFGGVEGETQYDDTWLWDGYAGTWTQVAQGSPGPRSHAALAYDAAGQQLLLFAGNSDGVLLSDTWAWNGEVWVDLNTPTSPPARQYHAMAYCPIVDAIVMFGGGNQAGALGDTWFFYDNSWVEGPAGPPPRLFHAMASDAYGQVVLFGGETPKQGQLADCWVFFGDGWSRGPYGPSARAGHAMAADSDRGAAVLFGGFGGDWVGDTWELDVAEPEVLTQPGDADVCLAEAATFAVTATGTGELWYQWLKDGVPLVDGPHISGATTPTLLIDPVSAADQGFYEVIVSDDCADAISDAAALNLLAETQISKHPADVVEIEGAGVSLQVEAGGVDVTYQWYKDGLPLADGPRISGTTNPLLTLDPLRPDDAGSYHVAVSGNCGTVLSNVALLAVWPDRDADSIPDDLDNCPDVPNEGQLDRDGDLVGDACDGCPDDPDKSEPGPCGCGAADDDTDGDGVPDCVDNCPTTMNADQFDTDDDGVGDVCDDDQAAREPPPLADSAFIRGLIDLIDAPDQPTDDSEYAIDVLDQALSSMNTGESGSANDSQSDEQTEDDDQAARLDILSGVCPAASATMLAVALLGLSIARRGIGGR